jgi:hypothetical protein
MIARSAMGAVDSRLRKLLPPMPVLVVLVALALVFPLASWAEVNIREWAYGGSPGAALDAPYFWGVLLLRLSGAFVLVLLLWFLRTPTSIWITITSVWLAGPVLQALLTGIVILAASGGHRSLPASPFHLLAGWSFGPAIITFCLLGFRSSRQAYGLTSQGLM